MDPSLSMEFMYISMKGGGTPAVNLKELCVLVILCVEGCCVCVYGEVLCGLCLCSVYVVVYVFCVFVSLVVCMCVGCVFVSGGCAMGG